MKESIVSIQKSPNKHKKYLAVVKNKKTGKLRKIHFGASSYQHYKDLTRIKSWKHKNHNDTKRRKNYFLRHSGVPLKTVALDKEIHKSKGIYNAKILSHKYLW